MTFFKHESNELGVRANAISRVANPKIGFFCWSFQEQTKQSTSSKHSVGLIVDMDMG